MLNVLDRADFVVGEVKGRDLQISVQALDLRQSVLGQVQLVEPRQAVQVLDLGQPVALRRRSTFTQNDLHFGDQGRCKYTWEVFSTASTSYALNTRRNELRAVTMHLR